MRRHGLRADDERVFDLILHLPLGEERENLALARTEVRLGRRPVPVPVREGCRRRGERLTRAWGSLPSSGFKR